MPCNICGDIDHNKRSCHMKAIPQYYDNNDINDIKKNEDKDDKMDGRRTAKKDEDIRVDWICGQLNTETVRVNET